MLGATCDMLNPYQWSWSRFLYMSCGACPHHPLNNTHVHVATAQQLADKFLLPVDECEETKGVHNIYSCSVATANTAFLLLEKQKYKPSLLGP